jgi:hypothetical protein
MFAESSLSSLGSGFYRLPEGKATSDRFLVRDQRDKQRRPENGEESDAAKNLQVFHRPTVARRSITRSAQSFWFSILAQGAPFSAM